MQLYAFDKVCSDPWFTRMKHQCSSAGITRGVVFRFQFCKKLWFVQNLFQTLVKKTCQCNTNDPW